MLRFNLFGFPITVHWMFWLTALLLGGGFSTGRGNPTIPLLAWTVALFTAILWHELGHAFFQRKYGGRPEIMIHGMGGYSSSTGRFSRAQQLTISFMGPLFGLLLGGVAYVILSKISTPPAFLAHLLVQMVWINIFLSLVNLLPVLPLDGGRICENLLGDGRQRQVMLIGMITGGVAAIAFQFIFGQIFLAILFGYFAYQNYQAYKQGYGSPNLPF